MRNANEPATNTQSSCVPHPRLPGPRSPTGASTNRRAQPSRWIRVRWACNSALLAAACLLIADTAANVMTLAAPRSPSRETPLARSSPSAAAEPSWAERQVILERNLFGPRTLDAAQPQQPEVLGKSRLPVTLVGTFAASEPSFSHATLYHRGRNETFVVGVGDPIEDRAVVVHVERRRIVLREDGVPRELTLDADQAASAPSRPEDRSLEAAVSDVEQTILDSMVGEARVLPTIEDGHVVGLEVSAIQEGSHFEAMGIEEGDVITQFNRIAIDSPAEALHAAREILRADGYDLISRRGDELKHLRGSFHGRFDGRISRIPVGP